MNKKWTEGFCNEKSGFLFSHSCSNTSRDHCSRCQKPICVDHCRYVEQQPCCIQCVKNAENPPQQRDDHNYHHDPYFYGSSYYNGYGYYHGYGYAPGYGMLHGHSHGSRSHSQFNDPNDFTDADAESLSNQDAQDFETDINES